MNATGGPAPGLFSEALGQLAYAFNEVQPYLPMYLHLIASALFPIFTGAHSSLSRPSSAAQPHKKAKKKRDEEDEEEEEEEEEDDDDDDDDDDEDGSITKMEGLSPSDAIVFPVLAGSTLASLYFLIKKLGPELINKVLAWYFSGMAIFSVAKLLNDGACVIESFCWPDLYFDDGVIWRVIPAQSRAIQVGETSTLEPRSRTSPLPGVLGRVNLPPTILRALWFLRRLPSQKYLVRFHLRSIVSFKIKLTLRTIISTVLGLSSVLISNFTAPKWYLTNLQGFAFSYSALQLMSPTTFTTGTMILIALFFYDIYFVFFTPMMVTVATKLDVPIKLLFPRPQEEGETVRRLAMLGLGDIVLPGIMVGLALRYDLHLHYLKQQTSQQPSASTPEEKGMEAQEDTIHQTTAKLDEQQVHKQAFRTPTGHWGNRFWTTSWTGRSALIAVPPPTTLQRPSPALRRALIPSFSKTYFYASIAGYVAGMSVTLGVMQVFKAAQPALLYLVPGVVGSLWLTAVIRGEVKEMWEFSEISEEEAEEGKEDGAKEKSRKDKTQEGDKSPTSSSSSWWSSSFFSFAKREKNAKILEKKLAESFAGDETSSVVKEEEDGAIPAERKGKEKEKKPRSSDKNSAPKSFIHLSIKPISARGKSTSKSTSSSMSHSKRRATDVLDEVDGDGATAVGSDGVAAAAASGEQRIPRWRGARISDDGDREERAEKRLRMQ